MYCNRALDESMRQFWLFYTLYSCRGSLFQNISCMQLSHQIDSYYSWLLYRDIPLLYLLSSSLRKFKNKRIHVFKESYVC